MAILGQDGYFRISLKRVDVFVIKTKFGTHYLHIHITSPGFRAGGPRGALASPWDQFTPLPVIHWLYEFTSPIN